MVSSFCGSRQIHRSTRIRVIQSALWSREIRITPALRRKKTDIKRSHWRSLALESTAYLLRTKMLRLFSHHFFYTPKTKMCIIIITIESRRINTIIFRFSWRHHRIQIPKFACPMQNGEQRTRIRYWFLSLLIRLTLMQDFVYCLYLSDYRIIARRWGSLNFDAHDSINVALYPAVAGSAQYLFILFKFDGKRKSIFTQWMWVTRQVKCQLRSLRHFPFPCQSTEFPKEIFNIQPTLFFIFSKEKKEAQTW